MQSSCSRMACATSVRRSRAPSSRASLRARDSRAAARRSCTSRKRLLALLQRGLGDRKVVGRLARAALGLRHGLHQSAAPLLDLGGKIGESRKVGAGLGLARAQRLDLLARIGDPLPPKIVLGLDRLEPFLTKSISRSKPSSAASARACVVRLSPASLCAVSSAASSAGASKCRKRSLDALPLAPAPHRGAQSRHVASIKGAEPLALGQAFVLGLRDRLARAIELVALP